MDPSHPKLGFCRLHTRASSWSVRTREEWDDGDVSVGTFFKVHHHLCGALPCVAPHWRPVLDVATPVDHGDYLPIIFIASIYSLFELHLRYCRKHENINTWIKVKRNLKKMEFQKTWFRGKNTRPTTRRTGSQSLLGYWPVFWAWANHLTQSSDFLILDILLCLFCGVGRCNEMEKVDKTRDFKISVAIYIGFPS